MPNDELDDLLRRAMKTLDDQVPSGYFEGLPGRTLARLEDSSMHTSSTTSGTNLPAASASGPIAAAAGPIASAAEPAAPQDRDEDSGLHDIRNLASSARMRISSRRVSTSPPSDENILASSSAGWKAVALPEPAKMVSLPELAELPAKVEVKQAEKASRKSRPSGQIETAASTSMPAAPVVEAPLHLEESKPVVAPIATPMIGSRIAGASRKMKAAPAVDGIPAKKSGKGVWLGVVGFGLAAAAGATIFVTTRNNAATESPSEQAVRGKGDTVTAAPPAPTVQAIATDEGAKQEAAGSAAAVEPAVVEPPKVEPTPPVVEEPKATKGKRAKADSKKPDKKIIEVDGPPDTAKPTKAAPPITKADKPKDGEPDFNELLKQAGVDENKPVKKPTLEKKALAAGDFKAAMGSIEKKALACYAGTQGTASFKLTVAPSGQVSSVNVTGQFSGTPVANCVAAAVRSATFPPWEGGPQSFNYSFLLSE